MCAVYGKPCIRGLPDTDCSTAFCKLDGGVHDRLAERHDLTRKVLAEQARCCNLKELQNREMASSPPPSLAAVGAPASSAPIHDASHLTSEVLESAFDFIRAKLLGTPSALGGPRTHDDLKRAVGAFQLHKAPHPTQLAVCQPPGPRTRV